MSGLFGALTNNVKALTAHSRSIETAGRNLANVNNANYARQRVVYGDSGTVQTDLGAMSMGLEAKSIEQLRDYLLDRQVVREVSIKSSYEAEQAALQKAQAGLGQSIDRTGETQTSGFSGNGAGVAESIAEFFNAFQSLAARPTDPGERETLLQKAGILADRMQITDTRLNQLQSDLTAQVQSDVDDVNRMLGQIANLNNEIGRFEIAKPGSAVDLRDQRQGLLEDLAKKINFESEVDTSATTNGQIKLFVKDGSGNKVYLVDNSTVTNTIALSGSSITAGASATPVVISGGSINGALTARDGTVQSMINSLDSIAHQLVVSVNAAYNPPPSAAAGNFFDPAHITAGDISVVSGLQAADIKATITGAAGDNDIAQAVADLSTKTFSTSGVPADFIDGTFAGSYSTAVTNLGQSLSSTNLRVEDQSNIEQLVRKQRDAVSGVSMDEELADMMKYQRAFQASSRVISTINELLDNVVNLGRA
ncbi:flagellar hook-associated protein FlgK [Opitutaceae bacterium EW11]|nr:flagellar hook-associated protein FlgK [Opitutaceae bacterium EW11]